MLPIILAIENDQDRNLVADVYEKNKRKLYLISFNILHNRYDAEDCVHDVIKILIDCLDIYKSYDELHKINFISRVCKNISLNKYNRNRNQWQHETSINDETFVELVDENADIEKIVINQETQQRLTELVDSLPSIHKDILFYKLFLNLDNNTIAKILNISNSSVNVRFHRARKKLIELIKEDFKYD